MNVDNLRLSCPTQNPHQELTDMSVFFHEADLKFVAEKIHGVVRTWIVSGIRNGIHVKKMPYEHTLTVHSSNIKLNGSSAGKQ